MINNMVNDIDQLYTIKLPKFSQNSDYTELSFKESKGKYRFKTLNSIIYKCSLVPKGTKISFRDGKNKEWLYIDHRHIVVARNYAWNGCSVKRNLPIFGWVGTPDYEETIVASLIHDALCQFLKTEHFPFKRSYCDEIFKELLDKQMFWGTEVYYMGASIGTILNLSTGGGSSKSYLVDY